VAYKLFPISKYANYFIKLRNMINLYGRDEKCKSNFTWKISREYSLPLRRPRYTYGQGDIKIK
jgi:hypothetical protein